MGFQHLRMAEQKFDSANSDTSFGSVLEMDVEEGAGCHEDVAATVTRIKPRKSVVAVSSEGTPNREVKRTKSKPKQPGAVGEVKTRIAPSNVKATEGKKQSTPVPSSNNKKRKAVSSPSLAVTTEIQLWTPEKAMEIAENARSTLERVALFGKQTKLNKVDKEELIKCIGEMERSLIQLALENKYLRGKNEALKSRPPATSFAEAVKGAVATTSRPPPVSVSKALPKAKPRRSYAVVVSATSSSTAKSAEELEKVVKAAINPQAEKIHIRQTRRTKAGKVVIETGSKADAQKVLQSAKLKEAGLTTNTPSDRLPRVIVYDLPRDASPESLVQEIYTLNEDQMRGIDFERFKRGCNFKFKVGPKDREEVHWVIEVTQEIRNALRSAEGGRIYTSWRRCRVLDFVSITRCFRCLGIGHVAAYCKAESSTCGHCGCEGHKRAECKKRDSPAVCALCKRKGKPAGHDVLAKDCPSYRTSFSSYVNSVHYDGPEA